MKFRSMLWAVPACVLLLSGCGSGTTSPLARRPLKDFDRSKFSNAPYEVHPIAEVSFLVGAMVPTEEVRNERQPTVEPPSFGTCEPGPTCGVDLQRVLVPTQRWSNMGNMECAAYVVIVRTASGVRVVDAAELPKLLGPIDTPREAQLVTFHGTASRAVSDGYEVISEAIDCDEITVTVHNVHTDGTSAVVRTYYQAPDLNSAC